MQGPNAEELGTRLLGRAMDPGMIGDNEESRVGASQPKDNNEGSIDVSFNCFPEKFFFSFASDT